MLKARRGSGSEQEQLASELSRALSLSRLGSLAASRKPTSDPKAEAKGRPAEARPKERSLHPSAKGGKHRLAPKGSASDCGRKDKGQKKPSPFSAMRSELSSCSNSKLLPFSSSSSRSPPVLLLPAPVLLLLPAPVLLSFSSCSPPVLLLPAPVLLLLPAPVLLLLPAPVLLLLLPFSSCSPPPPCSCSPPVLLLFSSCSPPPPVLLLLFSSSLLLFSSSSPPVLLQFSSCSSPPAPVLLLLFSGSEVPLTG